MRNYSNPNTSIFALSTENYNAAFYFGGLSSPSYMVGSNTNILVLSNTSNTGNSSYGSNLSLVTSPLNNGNGGVCFFPMLNFYSQPTGTTDPSSTFATGSSLEQTYTYQNISQLINTNSQTQSYVTFGMFGSILLNNNHGSENSAFRWQTMNNGSLYETMRLSQNKLLIGYTQSQGTYSLQVNGDSYISSSLSIGYTQSQGSYNLQINGNAQMINLYLSGNISASGSITAQTGGFDSDIRLKSDIIYNPIIEGIDTIRSASYIIRGTQHIGYIAQEVENIIPSSIIKKDDGYLALNYNEVLVAKISYLENKVKILSDIIERNGLK